MFLSQNTQQILHLTPPGSKHFGLLLISDCHRISGEIRGTVQVRRGKVEEERGLHQAHLNNQSHIIVGLELRYSVTADVLNSMLLESKVTIALAQVRVGTTKRLDRGG